MRINGQWLPSVDDEVVRPIVEAEVLAGDGTWKKFELLLDTGADRSALCSAVLERLDLPHLEPGDRLGGVGGDADYVVVETSIRLTSDAGDKIILRSEYAAFTEAETLDTSVLGREILNLFALIVDYRKDELCLLAKPHTYHIALIDSNGTSD